MVFLWSFPHSCRVKQRPDKYPRQFVLLNNYNIEIEYICHIGCSVIYLTTELHKVRHRYCNIDVTPCLISTMTLSMSLLTDSKISWADGATVSFVSYEASVGRLPQNYIEKYFSLCSQGKSDRIINCVEYIFCWLTDHPIALILY